MAQEAGETIPVRHMVHYKAMTESDSKFVSLDGKRPARILFCEFFDNSIAALLKGTVPSKMEDPPAMRLHLVCFALMLPPALTCVFCVF